MRTCGIYLIEAISGNPAKVGWKYVGQSENCSSRFSRHRRDLFFNKHDNPKLQAYYNKYGEGSLKFFVLKKLSKEQLDFYEKFFIKIFNSETQGFNCNQGGNKPPSSSKRCTMQNMLTGEIVEFNSRDEFATKYGLNTSQVCRVILGKSRSVGEWFCPEQKWRHKTYQVMSPEGKIFDVFCSSDFCREHNISSNISFSRLLRGERRSANGWTVINGKIKQGPTKSRAPFHGKKFKLIGPDNKIYEEDSVNRFARQFNLAGDNLRLVINETKKSYKGWTLYKENL